MGARPSSARWGISRSFDLPVWRRATAVAFLEQLTHQAQMHNLITLTNYQTRLALYALAKNTVAGPVQAAFTGDGSSLDALPEATRHQIQKPADQLLRYLLFANETPLGGLNARQEIASSSFAREFAARGVRDSQGRSLRDFDLHDRIFKYPPAAI